MLVECTCLACGNPHMRRACVVRERNYCSVECQRVGRGLSTTPLEISADGATARVPLLTKNGDACAYAIIDAADAESVGRWKWHLSPSGYAYRSVRDNDVRHGMYFLHRQLMGFAPGEGNNGTATDHISRDKLDDRRSNLRVIPRAGNGQNRPSHGGSSRYRGVQWRVGRGKWIARLTVNGKKRQVGTYATEEAAAEAAKAARLRLMPYAVD